VKQPPYPKYKPSDVEWLGDVPVHWQTKRLKNAVQLRDRKVESDSDEPVPYIGMENIESWTGRILPIDSEVVPAGTANAFEKKHTLFGKLRPYLAKACNPEFNGLCSTELLVLESAELDRRNLLYSLLSDGFIKLIDSSTFGSKMPRANWEFIGNCVVPIAPPDEQRAIADFLDRETVRLDTLVGKKRELIERLKEKRTALISRTVTRGLPPTAAPAAGLDPKPKLKRSDSEWLGDIPAHWQATRVGFVVTKIGSGKTPRGGAEVYQSEGVMLIRSQNVYDEGLRLDDVAYIAKEIDQEMAGTRVVEGDVLINITGASLGRCATVPAKLAAANVNQHVCIVRPARTKVIANFLQRALVAQSVKAQIFADETGSSREGLNFQQVRNLSIARPPIGEQRAIAEYLDHETAKLDRMMEKVEAVIAKLQEYRTALITAAVTGKIDVRGTAA